MLLLLLQLFNSNIVHFALLAFITTNFFVVVVVEGTKLKREREGLLRPSTLNGRDPLLIVFSICFKDRDSLALFVCSVCWWWWLVRCANSIQIAQFEELWPVASGNDAERRLVLTD